VLDLSEPKLPERQQTDVLFSHTFFEHLRRDARVPHLAALRGSLAPDGVVCSIGLPDFERIAQRYLRTSRTGWEAQLHKSLFDVAETGRLLRDAGYGSYVVFRYAYPGEDTALELTSASTAARATRTPPSARAARRPRGSARAAPARPPAATRRSVRRPPPGTR
jgi:hypothetical protein